MKTELEKFFPSKENRHEYHYLPPSVWSESEFVPVSDEETSESRFKVAGNGTKLTVELGLPQLWHNLSSELCPRCSAPLVLFQNLSKWKCQCGFKISDYLLKKTTSDLFHGSDITFVYGWKFCKFEDDFPF